MKSVIVKSDVLGAASSALCLIHCLATPLLFFYSTSPFTIITVSLYGGLV